MKKLLKLVLIGSSLMAGIYFLTLGENSKPEEIISLNITKNITKKITKSTEKDFVKVSQAAVLHPKINRDGDEIEKIELSEKSEELNWEILVKEWHEFLLDHLMTLNEAEAQNLFNLFMDEKKEFDRIFKFLNKQQDSMLLYDDAGEMIGVKDSKLLAESTKQQDKLHEDYVKKVKKIFGSYYSGICELRRTFESGVASHAPFIVDIAFTEL